MKTCAECGYKFHPSDYAREETMNCPRCGGAQEKVKVLEPVEPAPESAKPKLK